MLLQVVKNDGHQFDVMKIYQIESNEYIIVQKKKIRFAR